MAFYTLGDQDMTPRWKKYAETFVATRGPAIGAKTQQEAVKELNALHDTNLKEVFFVGHGLDGSIKVGPAFMLSGKQELNPKTGHMGFYTHGDPDLLIQGVEGPLLRALASHLSIEGQAILAFLSCHTGTDKVFQHNVAGILAGLEPALDVKVEAYKEIYRVARDYSNNAHLAVDRSDFERDVALKESDKNADPNETEQQRVVRQDEAGYRRVTIDYQAPERPICHLAVEVKNLMEIDPVTVDPLAEFDSYGDDPLAGMDL